MAYVIGISGGSGSGKSTFLKSLMEQFTDSHVTFISQDDYYLTREEQVMDGNGIKNFDLPTSIDSELLTNHLQTLMSGNDVTKQEYTFNNALKEPTIKHFKSNPIIVIEGLFIYHFTEIAAMCDMKLFIDAPTDLRIIRRINRDQVERNYPLDDVLYRYQHHVSPAYDSFIAPYRDTCDIIINNIDGMDSAIELMTTHINQLING